MNRKPELLAPAGDIPSLKAALLAGADAVYLGGKHFGARAFAPNFDEASLRWARQVTRAMGRRLYITLNTLVFDHEFGLLEKMLDFYEELKPDALIVQDLGVITLLNRRQSALPKHLSTQAAWEGIGGEAFLHQQGITRIIVPRETPLSRLRDLATNSGFEIEAFVHGAMCYSISGRCYWSATLGDRSGNRGTCAQPCRKPYRIPSHDDENRWMEPNQYPFSPRDLRLLDRIRELVDAKIFSLKIEGRMKDADYVFRVVQTYRRMLDGFSPSEIDHQRLTEVFSRPWHEGFINGTPGSSWATNETPGRQGVLIGRVTGAKRPGGLVEVELLSALKAGDGIAWELDNTRSGARLTWIEKIPSDKSRRYLVRGLPDLPRQTQLFLTDSQDSKDWLKLWSKDYERQPVDLFWSGFEGQPLAIETVLNGRAIRILSGEPLIKAREIGLEQGILQEKFAGVGDQFKTHRHVTKALEPGLFLSPIALKKLKRDLLNGLLQLEKIRFNPCPPATAPVANYPHDGVYAPKKPGMGYVFRGSQEPEETPAPSIPIPKVQIRLWNYPDFIPNDLLADRYLLPLIDDEGHKELTYLLNNSGETAQQERRAHGARPRGMSHANLLRVAKGGACPPLLNSYELPCFNPGFWIPTLGNEAELDRLIILLQKLPSQEFLCPGWEAFRLKQQLPMHFFRVDWTFNIANTTAAELLFRNDLGVTASREWPPEHPPVDPRIIWTIPWNPLVSLSRFPPKFPTGEIFANAHGDRFFLLDLGKGVSGLFLKNRPESLNPPGNLPLQVDVAFAPDEEPKQVWAQLKSLLGKLRKGLNVQP